jgi:hypothetical protein
MMAALVREAEANRQRDPELYNGLFPRVVQNPIGGMVEEIGERERAHVRAGVGAGSESDGESEQLVSRSESDAEDVSDSPLRHVSGSGSSALPDFSGVIEISRLLIWRQRQETAATRTGRIPVMNPRVMQRMSILR